MAIPFKAHIDDQDLKRNTQVKTDQIRHILDFRKFSGVPCQSLFSFFCAEQLRFNFIDFRPRVKSSRASFELKRSSIILAPLLQLQMESRHQILHKLKIPELFLF